MRHYLQPLKNRFIFLALAVCYTNLASIAHTILTAAQKKDIGMQIWRNEAGGRYDQLVFWKTNEKFPSLGICHFIWYPKKDTDMYTQTFPSLLTYFKKKKVKLPAWLAHAQYAPWQTKEEFDNAAQTSQVQELRKLMFDTMDLQVDFIIERLKLAWPRILAAADRKKQKQVEYNYNQLMRSPQGMYALIDYLNFKGEGTDWKERYNGMGWGLLQVLENMQEEKNTVSAFVTAAKAMLSTRVANAPAHKGHEKEWLKGWHNRINSYLSFQTLNKQG